MAEVFLGFFDFGERCSLVFAALADSSPSCEHEIEVSSCIVQQLDLVEHVLAIKPIVEVYLGEVDVPVLIALLVHFILLSKVSCRVDRHQSFLLSLLFLLVFRSLGKEFRGICCKVKFGSCPLGLDCQLHSIRWMLSLGIGL